MENILRIREPIYYKFWFSWFVITVVYLVLQMLDMDDVAYCVGLFAPIGFWTLFVVVASIKKVIITGILSIISILLSFFYADKIAAKMNIHSNINKIGFNLVYLFLLTILVDLLMWGEWASWKLLTEGFPAI